MVNTGDGGLAELLAACEGANAKAVVVLLIDGFSEGFGAVATGPDAGEVGKERLGAGNAEISVGVDDELSGFFEAVEVADLALIAAFAEQMGGMAVGAVFGAPEGNLELDIDGSRS